MTTGPIRNLVARHRGRVVAAVAAVLACVGVPLVVAHQRPSAPTPARAAVPVAATAAAAAAAPSSAPAPPAHRPRPTTVPRYAGTDPFGGTPAAQASPHAPHHRRRSTGTAHPTPSATSTTASAGHAPAPTATTAAQAPSAPAVTGAPAPAPARVAIYGADVRLSRVGTVAPLLRDLPRLAVLGRHASPVAVFAGLRPDHRAAAFVLGPGISAPAARCAVPATACRIIVVRAGRRVRLQGAGDATYWLRLRRITVRRVSAPIAVTARRRVSAAGRCYLGALGIADLRAGADGVDIRWADRATPCR